MMQLLIESDEQMQALGKRLANTCEGGGMIHLDGDLGTGKTTLVRGMLRGLGHEGAVKSPTFTIVEPYDVAGRSIYHFDLYRLSDPEELEYMGGRDYFAPDNLCLVEWPDKGGQMLPTADLRVKLDHAGTSRDVTLSAGTEHGQNWLNGLDKN